MTLDKLPLEEDESAIKGNNGRLHIDGNSERESIKKLGNINDVIQREKIITRDESEVFITRIHLSSWTLTLIDNIMIDSKLTSEKKMYQSLLSLGTVFMEENLKDLIKAQKELRAGILRDDNMIMAFLASRHSPISMGGDPILNSCRVTISMPRWTKDSLGRISELSGIQISSLRRMGIYNALSTAEMPDSYRKEIDNAISVFKKNVENILDIYNKLGGKS